MLRFDTQSDYLIDDAKVLSGGADEEGTLDLILHLPHSQDYLLRINVGQLASTPKQIADRSVVKGLAISNPFFGIQAQSSPTPIYFNSSYSVASNYHPNRSFLRYY